MPADVFLHVGEKLLARRDPLLRAFVAEKLEKLRRAASGMERGASARTSAAYSAVLERIEALEGVLKTV